MGRLGEGAVRAEEAASEGDAELLEEHWLLDSATLANSSAEIHHETAHNNPP